MKIAVPTVNGTLCEHFGHCQQFVVIDIDEDTKTIADTQALTPPAHQPGVFPEWLGSIGVSVVIAGGIGGRAIQLFNAKGIQVFSGAPVAPPDALARAYLEGSLVTSGDVCGGGHGGCEGHHD